MKLITFDDIVKLNITPEQCYEWVAEMIQNKNKATLPPKIGLHPYEGAFCNFMPSMIPDTFVGQVGGVKIVNRYPERIPSLDSQLMLINMESGEFLALMDANWITAMRTGAVCAHSIMHLAKKDFDTIAMLGLGNTARSSLLVLLHIMKDREFKIKLLRYKGQEELFAERFKEYSNVHFTYVDEYRDLVKGSDVVISCATYFETDICEDDYFDEGVLVVPVHTRGFSNCDLFFDKVYADDYGHVSNFKNFEKFKQFAEVCDVVTGNVPGRENDQERILAYNIGLSIHDIFFATKIYQILQDDEKLIDIELNSPSEKFWV